MSQFTTLEHAQTVRPDALRRQDVSRTGFLGVRTRTDAGGHLVAAAIAPDSPALKADIEAGDLILSVDGDPVASPDDLRALIQSKAPGQIVSLALQRGDTPLETTAKLDSVGAQGRPMDRVRLGIRAADARAEGGARVEEVDAGSSGERAGLQIGDAILNVNGKLINGALSVADALAASGTNSAVALSVLRAGNVVELRAPLADDDAPDRPGPGGRRGGFFGRGGFVTGRGFGPERRGTLRVAVIGIEFADQKHNPRIGLEDWRREFFSTNSYTSRSATGQRVFGSVNDYYLEQSGGAMRVEGTVFDWVTVTKNRAEYNQPLPGSEPGAPAGNGRRGGPGAAAERDAPLLDEVLDKFIAREGRRALDDFDGVVFLYAGRRAVQQDENVYWAHSTSLLFQGRRLRYVLCEEGGDRMTNISILCHELGHVLGLPDLYLQPQRNASNPGPATPASRTNPTAGSRSPPGRFANPYAEDAGNWDVMALQVNNGRPQHMGAWSKAQLGWVQPVLIDPRVRQKLVLAPVEKAPHECLQIPLRPDGSEYLLLENRSRIGFDASLPAEGLLIWRVVYGRPVLEEAHGVTGPNAALANVGLVPFPTWRNDAFTPYSAPSSAAHTGDELPVYITHIQRLPDGRIAFEVGDAFD